MLGRTTKKGVRVLLSRSPRRKGLFCATRVLPVERRPFGNLHDRAHFCKRVESCAVWSNSIFQLSSPHHRFHSSLSLSDTSFRIHPFINTLVYWRITNAKQTLLSLVSLRIASPTRNATCSYTSTPTQNAYLPHRHRILFPSSE